jgi:uncharacterized membrane protein
MKSKLLVGVVAVGLAAACGGDDGGGDDTPPASECVDTYNNYAKAFFATNCNTCHSTATFMALNAMYALDSLALVREHEEHVIEHAVELEEPKMPQNTQGLPEAERNRLKKWYACGAKE